MSKDLDHKYIATLVLKLQRGDSDAFTQIYGLTYNKVYNYARHYLRDDYLAQDAVQEIYISALKNLHKLNDPSLFIAWINRIAFHVCFDMTKSRNQGYGEVSAEMLEEISEIRSSDATPEDEAFVKDEETRLKAAVDALPPGEREIVTLRFYNNMKIDDIVDATGLSKSTVKRQLKSALDRLKNRMKD